MDNRGTQACGCLMLYEKMFHHILIGKMMSNKHIENKYKNYKRKKNRQLNNKSHICMHYNRISMYSRSHSR